MLARRAPKRQEDQAQVERKEAGYRVLSDPACRHRLEAVSGIPPSVRLAVVVGQPSSSGLYVIRVKVPSGVKLMPHRHPEDRVYTVMSGVFCIGLGDEFDGSKIQAYAPGGVVVL